MFDKEHEFVLDRKDLTQSTTDGNSMMPMEVIDNDDEESNDKNIDLIEDEENDIMIVMIIAYCFI